MDEPGAARYWASYRGGERHYTRPPHLNSPGRAGVCASLSCCQLAGRARRTGVGGGKRSVRKAARNTARMLPCTHPLAGAQIVILPESLRGQVGRNVAGGCAAAVQVSKALPAQPRLPPWRVGTRASCARSGTNESRYGPKWTENRAGGACMKGRAGVSRPSQVYKTSGAKKFTCSS